MVPGNTFRKLQITLFSAVKNTRRPTDIHKGLTAVRGIALDSLNVFFSGPTLDLINVFVVFFEYCFSSLSQYLSLKLLCLNCLNLSLMTALLLYERHCYLWVKLHNVEVPEQSLNTKPKLESLIRRQHLEAWAQLALSCGLWREWCVNGHWFHWVHKTMTSPQKWFGSVSDFWEQWLFS